MPLGVYGTSKAEAEWRVLTAMPRSLIIRTSAFFGPWNEHNFVAAAVAAVGAGQLFRAADDAFVSPTYVPDLANAALDLLLDGEHGIWHLVNDGSVTWAELARAAVAQRGLDPALVEGCPTAVFSLAAPRPLYSVLRTERGQVMPSLEDAIERYTAETLRCAAAADRAGRRVS